MVQVTIYQMKDGILGKFLGTQYDDFCALQNGMLSKEDYNKVYTCERPDGVTLEDLFYEFNNEHPKDFHGHSMSVSDAVEIDGKLYFCNSFGFDECRWA